MRNVRKRIEREGNIMSIYRCAVCGSSRVVPETKQEGYNKKQGILGMALFGLGGAVAGTSGNTAVYYHCADCGHTLNRCMSGVDKEFLEKYLLEPTNVAYIGRLREYKKQYPNIEWEEPIKEKSDNIKFSIQDEEPCTYEEHKKQLEEHKQRIEKFRKEVEETRPQQIDVARAILDVLYKTEKPCTISEIYSILFQECQEKAIEGVVYSNQRLSAAAMQLVNNRIIEKNIENKKAYFKAIPNSKDEAIKMLEKI